MHKCKICKLKFNNCDLESGICNHCVSIATEAETGMITDEGVEDITAETNLDHLDYINSRKRKNLTVKYIIKKYNELNKGFLYDT